MRYAGGDVRGIPVGPDADFFENLMHATQQSWPRPKLLILSYPHNPTTEVVDLDFFQKVRENYLQQMRTKQKAAGSRHLTLTCCLLPAAFILADGIN